MSSAAAGASGAAGAGAGAPTSSPSSLHAAPEYHIEKFDVPYERKYSNDDMILGAAGGRSITFTTKEGTLYKVSLEYFRPSTMISNFMDDGTGDADGEAEAEAEADAGDAGDDDNTFALSQLTDSIIPALFDFLKMHHDEPLQAIPEEKINTYKVKSVDDVIKQEQYATFIKKVFKAGLIFELMLAANYLCISELENLTGFYVAFLYKSAGDPEKVLATFGVSKETMDETELRELGEMKEIYKEYIEI